MFSRRNTLQFMSRAAFVVVAIAVAACNPSSVATERTGVAYATFSDVQGREVAAAELWQDRNNVVHADIQFHSLPEGTHAIHFHAVAQCDPSGATPFASAGAHYNPLGRQHGLDNPAGPHGGDAPNFAVISGGNGRATFNTDRVSITAGSTSLFDADGSSIVVHAAGDDQISQPAGNSGGRIACGVLRR